MPYSFQHYEHVDVQGCTVFYSPDLGAPTVTKNVANTYWVTWREGIRALVIEDSVHIVEFTEGEAGEFFIVKKGDMSGNFLATADGSGFQCHTYEDFQVVTANVQ